MIVAMRAGVGSWWAPPGVMISATEWRPGAPLGLGVDLVVVDAHLDRLTAAGGKRLYNLNGGAFTSRPFDPTRSYGYSPLLEASGLDASGRHIDAARLELRCPWLLGSSNSNGYRGVVAEQDASRFALSPRHIVPDDVILPMYSDGGSRPSYSLEPTLPADGIDATQNLSRNWASGEWTVRVTRLAHGAGRRRRRGARGMSACGPAGRLAFFRGRGVPLASGQEVVMGSGALTGRTIGHYLVLEELGRVGMGVVYEARDTRLGRLAALEVLRADSLGGDDATRRLLREAQTASSLNHPSILTIYDVGTDAGVDYIAMELVESGTLADAVGVSHGAAPSRSRR